MNKRKSLENFKKDFRKKRKNLIERAEEEALNMGMLKVTTYSFIEEGRDVKVCPYCETPNLVSLAENKDQNYTIYECKKCIRPYSHQRGAPWKEGIDQHG